MSKYPYRYYPVHYETIGLLMQPSQELIDKLIEEAKQRELGTTRVFQVHTYKVTDFKIMPTIGSPILVAVASLVET